MVSGSQSNASRGDSLGQSQVSGIVQRPIVQCLCPHCGSNNSSDRRYCAGCGAAIWEPCLKCTTVNLAGEKFCGVCGANLPELLQLQVSQIEENARKARQLQNEARYREAIPILQKIAGLEHPRLQKFAEGARGVITRLKEEQAGREKDRERALGLARKLAEQRDYDGACAAIEAIPAALHNEEMKDLLAELEAPRREIEALNDEIRSRVANKQLTGLLSRVERLLELQPHHAVAQSLLQKLKKREQEEAEKKRETLLEVAKRHLNAFHYADALESLQAISPNARSPQFEKMLEFAKETECLDRLIRAGHTTSEHLFPLVNRLLKLRPEDPFCKQLSEELLAPDKTNPAGSLAALRLQHQRQQGAKSLIGCPLAALRGLRRIQLPTDKPAPPAWKDRDGGWGVALGLALQGLGQAAFTLNLKPEEKGLKKLLGGQLLKKAAKAAWGIDFGRSALKAVRLTWNAQENTAILDAAELIEYSQPLGQNDASPEVILKEAVKTLLDRQPLTKEKETAFAINLGGQECLSRFFKTPPIERKRLPDLVGYEAKNQIPFDLSQFRWDYQIMGSAADVAADFSEYQIAVQAARLLVIEQRINLLQEHKLRVDVVQSDPAALHNYLVFDRYDQAAAPLSTAGTDTLPAKSDSLFVTIDIGADTSNVLFGNAEFFWTRNIPFGAQEFTKALIRELKLTQSQAEATKRNPANAPKVHQVFEAFEPTCEQLVSQLQHTVRCFENLYPRRVLKLAMLHGGCAQQLGLLHRLREPAEKKS